ncbi:MAG: hypothetical protein ABI761_06865 [Saprospiraceae bacterium]
MKRFILLFCSLSSLFSCRTWQDSDLYIPEVFINEKNELYLILKNSGHTYIDRQHIDLVVYWDEDQRIVFDLDSLDPHFRNGGDSSIIRLPFIPGLNSHHILARVDTKNILPESDEDHNTYSRTIRSPLLPEETNKFKYPKLNATFDAHIYQDLINSSPISQLAQWDIGGRVVYLQYWPPAWKDLLLSHIEKIYSGEAIEYPDTLSAGYSHDQAFDIYLTYLAHSFYLEAEHLVPWSVNDFNPSDIKDLWDAHQYFQWDSIHKVFELNYESSGAIRVFHPLASYLFAKGIQTNDHFENQQEAIKSVLNWSRAYLHHTERTGQIYFQSVPQTLYPSKGKVHAVFSCWATGGMLMEYCRALNLPVRRSNIELFNGIHTQLSFPSMDWHLTHADDLYDPLFYPLGKDIPISSVMMTNKEYDEFINRKPICMKDTCHSSGTQHTYDRRRVLSLKAASVFSPDLLHKYDESGSDYKAFLRGDEFNSFLLPALNATEQKELTAGLLQNKTDHVMIHNLYVRYQNCKNNRR